MSDKSRTVYRLVILRNLQRNRNIDVVLSGAGPALSSILACVVKKNCRDTAKRKSSNQVFIGSHSCLLFSSLPELKEARLSTTQRRIRFDRRNSFMLSAKPLIEGSSERNLYELHRHPSIPEERFSCRTRMDSKL